MKRFLLTVLLVSAVMGCSFAQTKSTTKPVANPKAPTSGSAKPTPPRDLPAQKPAPAKPDPAKQPGEEEMRRIQEEYMTPGENHERLAKSTGEWKEEIKMWMAPGTEPMVNLASCSVEMILGGRYQESIHRGVFNGMPFEGRGIVGYDNAARKFYSSWIDNMGTGIMFTEGVYDDKTNTVVFRGEMIDPVTKKAVKIREVVLFRSDTEQLFEMYTTPAGGVEFKSMEIRMTR